MKLIRASAVIGLPVVSIQSGEDVAEIRDVVYDGETHRLVGFTLNKRGFLAGRLKAVLAAGSLAAIGPDSVMIESESAIADESGSQATLQNLDDARPVLGNRVLSADGTDLGEVVEVILSTGDRPEAVGYELKSPSHSDTSFVPISAQLALSGENVVVPIEATRFIRGDFAGFGAAVASYRSEELENQR